MSHHTARAGGAVPLIGDRPPPHATALLTAGDVAALLQVPATWVYAEARAGRIPHVTLGRYRRFRREAIDEWLAAAERGPVR